MHFVRMSHGCRKSSAPRAMPPRRFQRLQPGRRRFRESAKDQRASILRHRRSHQHHARNEHQRAEHGQEHAGAGFERERNVGFHRPDGRFHPARRGYGESAARHLQPFARRGPSASAPWRRRQTGSTASTRTIQSSAEIIDVLGHRADDIGKIIEVIDDLAEQTNLLALNAAIEAARAGEHGLGFAVVADEVRKLAEKSTQSTKEIAELIQSIQSEARKAVENMERSTRIVNEGLSLGQRPGHALHKISNVVTEVYKFSQEIGAATNEQSVGSSQIAKATRR